MSSPGPERDFARTLAAKAAEDLDALDALHDRGGIADAILGFHAQQAIEKAFKALLVDHGWELRRTHDLQFLIEQAYVDGLERTGELPGYDAAALARALEDGRFG